MAAHRSRSAPTYATLDDWIAHETIPFALDSSTACDDAIDAVIAGLDDAVELLGVGEAFHGGEDFLVLRNRIFQRLVVAHGYSAIAIESSLPRGREVNAYIAGGGAATYAAVQETGFSHGFGRLDANRELVEWMRQYNNDPAHRVKLRFYGFDMPGGTGHPISPRRLLHDALDYLALVDRASADRQRERIEPLLGTDASWENPMAWRDPVESVELVSAATALRIATEDAITALRTRRPALLAASDKERYAEAMHDATTVREMLNFYVALADDPAYTGSLAVRDALLADNLAFIVERERGRGKLLVFAHNSHLQRGQVHMPIGPDVFTWWGSGAHADTIFGSRYAVIGAAVGVSEANGIGQPEAGTLEARLTATPGPARFIPTHRGQGLPAATIAALPLRSRSLRNPSYIAPLSPQSLTDFDYVVVLDSTTYQRGGPPLPQPATDPKQ